MNITEIKDEEVIARFNTLCRQGAIKKMEEREKIQKAATPDQEQLEKQSREAVIAYLQDSSVPLEFRIKESEITDIWITQKDNRFCLDTRYYRIAQPNPWYRVALLRAGVAMATETEQEKTIETLDVFIKWLTERIEYDNS